MFASRRLTPSTVQLFGATEQTLLSQSKCEPCLSQYEMPQHQSFPFIEGYFCRISQHSKTMQLILAVVWWQLWVSEGSLYFHPFVSHVAPVPPDVCRKCWIKFALLLLLVATDLQHDWHFAWICSASNFSDPYQFLITVVTFPPFFDTRSLLEVMPVSILACFFLSAWLLGGRAYCRSVGACIYQVTKTVFRSYCLEIDILI